MREMEWEVGVGPMWYPAAHGLGGVHRAGLLAYLCVAPSGYRIFSFAWYNQSCRRRGEVIVVSLAGTGPCWQVHLLDGPDGKFAASEIRVGCQFYHVMGGFSHGAVVTVLPGYV